MCIAKWNVSWVSGLIFGTFLLTFYLEPQPCKPGYLNHSSMKVWLEKETEKQVPTNCVIFGSACMESRKACWDDAFCFRLSYLKITEHSANVFQIDKCNIGFSVFSNNTFLNLKSSDWFFCCRWRIVYVSFVVFLSSPDDQKRRFFRNISISSSLTKIYWVAVLWM